MKRLGALALFLVTCLVAHPLAGHATGYTGITDAAGAQTCITANPCPVNTVAQSGTGGFAAATLTTASAQVLAAATSRKLLALDNESATAVVACAFGAPAALNAAGSFTLQPLQTRSWAGPYVPADAVNCISSGTSPLTVEAH